MRFNVKICLLTLLLLLLVLSAYAGPAMAMKAEGPHWLVEGKELTKSTETFAVNPIKSTETKIEATTDAWKTSPSFLEVKCSGLFAIGGETIVGGQPGTSMIKSLEFSGCADTSGLCTVKNTITGTVAKATLVYFELNSKKEVGELFEGISLEPEEKGASCAPKKGKTIITGSLLALIDTAVFSLKELKWNFHELPYEEAERWNSSTKSFEKVKVGLEYGEELVAGIFCELLLQEPATAKEWKVV